MTAMEDRDVTNHDIATEFQTDRFVAPSWLDGITGVGIAKGSRSRVFGSLGQRVVLLTRARLRSAAHQAFAPNQPRAENRNVLEVFAPDQTVVPVAMTKVLIGIPGIRLGQIVSNSFRCLSGEYRRALIEIERDIAS